LTGSVQKVQVNWFFYNLKFMTAFVFLPGTLRQIANPGDGVKLDYTGILTSDCSHHPDSNDTQIQVIIKDKQPLP